MNSSLDKLVKHLSDGDFKYLSGEFNGEKLELVKEKGIYPYEYFDSVKTLGQYHDLYLKTDVLLLCDIFEKFISVYLKDYGLDPCHYFSSPELSWDAMLKMTGIKLEKVSNIDVHL